MTKITEEIKKLLAEEKRMHREAVTYIDKAPKGVLKYQRINDKVYYYSQENNTKRIYIKRNQMDLVQKLAQKDYMQRVKKNLSKQIQLIQKFICEFDEESLEKIYNELPEIKKLLVKTLENDTEKIVEKWENEKYEPYRAFPENMIYETEKGEMVRSKSEVIIANVLYHHREILEYRYEKPLELKTKDGKYIVIHPDFTIINKKTGKIYYYEHAGCMSDAKYASDFVKKINLYANNNIIQGSQLLVSYEAEDASLDINCVKKLVRSII